MAKTKFAYVTRQKVYRRKGKRPSFPHLRYNWMNPNAKYNIAFAPFGKRYSKKKNSKRFELVRIPDDELYLPF